MQWCIVPNVAVHHRCRMGCLIWVLLLLVQGCSAQFPRACMQNITDKTGVCCPGYNRGYTCDSAIEICDFDNRFKKSVSSQWISCKYLSAWDPPCGGSNRGVCMPLADAHETFYPAKPDHMKDDRLNWPKSFFQKVCHCFGNRAGYACHECKFGYHGPECNFRRIQKRRNILSLTKQEQQRFIDLILKSKVTNSDYVGLQVERHDPPEGPVKFVNLTVYDFFIYIHFYSARHTYVRNDTKPCDTTRTHFDFSHEGAGFPTFHRLLMLLWEREFQKVARDDTFMFPYWDWVENGHKCEVCTNDLLGAVNYSDPKGFIDKRSLYKWYQLIHINEMHFG